MFRHKHHRILFLADQVENKYQKEKKQEKENRETEGIDRSWLSGWAVFHRTVVFIRGRKKLG